MDYPTQYQVLTFSLIPDTLLSVDYNLFLNGLTSIRASEVISDATGVLYVGEQVSYGDRTVEILGSGTAQPGVEILSLVVPTGFPVDVVYMRDTDTGELILAYPEGPPNILSAIALVLTIDEVGYDLNSNAPVCFCKGTRIATPKGLRRVETIQQGDSVLDCAGRPVTVLACLSSHYPEPPEHWRPVVFESGALGYGLPQKRLKVSPQHRFCLPGMDPTNGAPWLGPANAFTGLPRIRKRRKSGPVTYYHLVTERHILLMAEGVPAESLLLAERTLKHLQAEVREELFDVLGVDEQTYRGHPAAQPYGTLMQMQAAKTLVEAWSIQQKLSPSPPWPLRPNGTVDAVA